MNPGPDSAPAASMLFFVSQVEPDL